MDIPMRLRFMRYVAVGIGVQLRKLWHEQRKLASSIVGLALLLV